MDEAFKPACSRDMAKQVLQALGLEGVPGVVSLQINLEAGGMPRLTVIRHITRQQAEMFCAVLKEWQCELVPTALATERKLNADGSVGEAEFPPFPSLHPREG